MDSDIKESDDLTRSIETSPEHHSPVVHPFISQKLKSAARTIEIGNVELSIEEGIGGREIAEEGEVTKNDKITLKLETKEEGEYRSAKSTLLIDTDEFVEWAATSRLEECDGQYPEILSLAGPMYNDLSVEIANAIGEGLGNRGDGAFPFVGFDYHKRAEFDVARPEDLYFHFEEGEMPLEYSHLGPDGTVVYKATDAFESIHAENYGLIEPRVHSSSEAGWRQNSLFTLTFRFDGLEDECVVYSTELIPISRKD